MKMASSSESVEGKGNTRTCTNVSSSGKGKIVRKRNRLMFAGVTSQVHFFVQD
jgi:hypothetical protein